VTIASIALLSVFYTSTNRKIKDIVFADADQFTGSAFNADNDFAARHIEKVTAVLLRVSPLGKVSLNSRVLPPPFRIMSAISSIYNLSYRI